MVGLKETFGQLGPGVERCLRFALAGLTYEGQAGFLNTQIDGVQENAHQHVSVFVFICGFVGGVVSGMSWWRRGLQRVGEQAVVESFMCGWQG